MSVYARSLCEMRNADGRRCASLTQICANLLARTLRFQFPSHPCSRSGLQYASPHFPDRNVAFRNGLSLYRRTLKPDLSTKPHVVATVTQPADLLYFFNGGTSKADVLEFRLDTLHAEIHDAFVTVVDSEYPILATARRAAEGGSLKLGDKARIALYEQFLPEVDIVDTEISSLRSDSFSSFPDLVTSHKAQLLGSFHDFEGYPGIETLKDKVSEAYDLGAKVAKIAVILEEMSDLFAVVDLVEHHRSEGRLISAMGMGPLGKLSRLVLARAGSCLNYGYLQSPNAPGQWPADDLAELIKEV